MRSATGIFGICILLIVGLGSYLMFFHKNERTAYFYNQKVFDQFKGKLELESRLKAQVEQHNKKLDSLRTLVENGRTELTAAYNEQLQQATSDQEQLSARYTADIWKHINDEVANFGRKEGYDYIFGASGNGSLMYADSSHDITSKIVDYLNQKYSK